MSLILDAAAEGVPGHLEPFHRTNLLLHLLSTVAVVALMTRFFDRPIPIILAALLFGLHPLVVTPLAWVAQREILLAGMFSLWSLVAYVAWTRRRNRIRWLAVAAAFVGALLASPTAVVLPFMLLCLDYWPLRRAGRRAVLEKIPHFVMAIVVLCLAAASSGGPGSIAAAEHVGVGGRVLLSGYLVILYLSKVVWPTDLTPIYPVPEPLSLSNPLLLAGAMGFAALLLFVLLSIRRARVAFVGGMIFLLGVAATTFLAPLAWGAASPGHLYLPLVGVLLLFVAALHAMWGARLSGALRWGRTVLVVGVVAAIGGAAWASRQHYEVWRDSETLMLQMLAHAPEQPALQVEYGDLLHTRGRYAEAIDAYESALAQVGSAPFQPHLLAQLGDCYDRLNQWEVAQTYFARAVALRPDYAAGYSAWAMALARHGETEQAIAKLERALQLDPDSPEAHNNLGAALAQQGAYESAIQHFRAAIKSAPGFVSARANLARALRLSEQLDAALVEYGLALSIAPDNLALRGEYADVLVEQEQFIEAAEQYYLMLDLDPNHIHAREMLRALQPVLPRSRALPGGSGSSEALP
jgi:tetratricopeptide (TPR) repeat protein